MRDNEYKKGRGGKGEACSLHSCISETNESRVDKNSAKTYDKIQERMSNLVITLINQTTGHCNVQTERSMSRSLGTKCGITVNKRIVIRTSDLVKMLPKKYRISRTFSDTVMYIPQAEARV